ncbi:hypothetical protein GCM10009744_54010 [Kribbella alba]|uniref:Uncharacterized protein n=1 Tax=Kribbella alba TaxID=190197 RepID=A0ABN2FNB0_9ACTN
MDADFFTRPRRPSPEHLRELQADLLVVVTGRSKSHNPNHLTATIQTLAPRATTATSCTAQSFRLGHTD